MPERDLPALWRSPHWRAEIEAWLIPALADAGVTVTGPVVQERVRFWSTVLHVETDAGRVWVKENAPSQAFEAALVEVVDDIVPGLCAPLLAVDTERGWLATADLGLPLWHDDDPPPVDDWVAVVQGYAAAQRVLADHADAVLAAGVPHFPEDPDDVVRWVTGQVDALRALPAQDPRRPTDEESALVDEGLDRIHDAAAALAGSGLPATLQHNDLHLGNAFRRPDGGIAYIDLGDAVWTHPLTMLRIPLWIMRHRLGLAEDDAAVRRARDAGLEPWTDRWDHETLVGLLPAADRLSCLHRAESWGRTQGDVPLSVVDDSFLREVIEWVVDAAAPDPYASAIVR
ncbi:MAG TPA: phosphotransferase [Ornithinibacter sp.]|nr:phosphotransferase [Ornithinibacter sp.]